MKRASNSANAATADGAPLSSAPAERQVPLGLGEERLLQGGRDLSEDGEGGRRLGTVKGVARLGELFAEIVVLLFAG